MSDTQYFFSYARGDSDFVLNLAKKLRMANASLWLDQLDILGGEHWDRAVEAALMSSQGMIAVLSPEAVESKNVMDEISFALEDGMLVVPVLYRSCDVPFRLRRLQRVDFTVDFESGYSGLLRALRIEPPPPEPETSNEQVATDRNQSAPGPTCKATGTSGPTVTSENNGVIEREAANVSADTSGRKGRLWFRVIATIGTFLAALGIGYLTGNLFAVIAGSGYIGAVPTWAVGIWLTVWVWRRVR